MTIKIERVPITTRKGKESLKEFVITLGKIEIGQSFLFEITAYHRHAISVVQYLTEKRFITRHDKGDLHRIVRIE